MDYSGGNILLDYSEKKEERILDSVLAALNDESIDPELKRRMQSWFLSDFADNAAKQEAFVRYAGRLAPNTGELEGDDLARYVGLAARLGIEFIPVRERITPPERESLPKAGRRSGMKAERGSLPKAGRGRGAAMKTEQGSLPKAGHGSGMKAERESLPETESGAWTKAERGSLPKAGRGRGAAMKSGRRSAAKIWRFAAVLLPAAAVVGLWLVNRGAEPAGHEMTIAVSDNAQSLFLPDSSFVSVSPGSTLTYREAGDGGSRMVDLSGGAMFMVRAEGGRDFSVSTARMTVNVSGTDFAVSDYPGSSCAVVELFDGVVNVTAGGVDTTLHRGETLTRGISANGVDISVIPASRMIEKGYKPRLKFDRATVGEVVAALSAFHGVEIVIAPGIDGNTGSISGDIEDCSPEKAIGMILRMWEQNVARKMEGNKIIIYRK